MIRSKPPQAARAAFMPETGSLGERLARIRQRSLDLAAPLTAEDCQIQSMPDASPTKWHLAHVTWFFETFVLERFEPGFVPFDPSFRVLFNSYYQGIGERHPRPQRGLITRPTLETVLRYRHQIDERLLNLMASKPVDRERDEVITIGLHHEQQHQELLLTDIKHALSFDPNPRAYARRWPMTTVQPQALRWFRQEGGLVEHGHDADLDGPFCFDNETPRHRVYIPPFEIASRPTSYGDFLAFMEDGGYRRPELWLSMGWDWVNSGSRSAPPSVTQRRSDNFKDRPAARACLHEKFSVDLLQLGEDRRVLECGRVLLDLLALGNRAQQASHDLARARLRQVLAEADVLRLGDRPDLLRHPVA